MENENFKPDSSEEEYNFSETESIPAFTEAQTKKSIFEKIKRKNVIIVFGVIVAVLIVYKVMDVLFSSAKPNKQMTMVKNPPAIHPISQPEKTIALPSAVPTQTAPSPVMPQQVSMDDVSKKLDSIEERNQANVDKLSSQVNELQNVIANLEARLNSLNNTTQDLVMQQEKAAAKKAAKLKPVKQPVVAPKPVYYVRALVPGRAWLEAARGGTLTVSLGDNLPGYGIVTMIDVNQGTLTTSSGAIIGYSPEDS